MSRSRLLVLAALVVLVVLFFALGGHRYLTLEELRARQDELRQYHAAHPWQAALGYFLVYVAVTGLSLPGAAVLTLFGGAIFGLAWGTLIVSFASSIGATLAFLAARFLLRDWVQAKFGARLRAVNEGVAKEGAFYLFALRLVPAFPFVLINLAMGLTPIRTWTFYWVSQLGMLAGTVVYVYAGAQLALCLWAAQEQLGQDRDLDRLALETEPIVGGVFPFQNATAAFDEDRDALAAESVQGVLDVVRVVGRHGVAVRLLVARGHDRRNRHRVILGRRLLLFDQHAKHAPFGGAERLDS